MIDPTPQRKMSAQATEAECELALDTHVDQLMSLPHVGGVGIGETEEQGGYVINVYTDDIDAGGIPSSVPLPGGGPEGSKSVPVRAVYQGTPLLQ